ncbi:hypothetical protein GDO86_010352 [Hymenochirus boettgeri]|uniref:Alpha 1,4-glycosyltransferase domain-containing protein n=1 Tax=Hymenochirus boettgeri TaxID=247094 RepID=A0A8T2JQ61_9PIPI|nr:hypothetical protein GDO86_010352 [Hymenochirus boettgeri]
MNALKVSGILLFAATAGFIFTTTQRMLKVHFLISRLSKPSMVNKRAEEILKHGNGVIFLETTDRMEPSSLVLCSIESAARVYPDRPVVYFMKGLQDINSEDDEKRAKGKFPSLSPFNNVHILPLRLDELFNNTPLLPWYIKANPKNERFWIHNLSDGCRMTMIWKYGGLYFDTDVISMRPITEKNFLTAEHTHTSGSSVFGLTPHHSFAWKSLNDFVQNYNGGLWGNQGPSLFTRVLSKLCVLSDFKTLDHIVCGNITFMHPQRIYPIPYEQWKKYFEVWDNMPSFNNSYALHLWNYMNSNEKKTVVIGSNTLVENLYKYYCPLVYDFLLNNKSTVI